VLNPHIYVFLNARNGGVLGAETGEDTFRLVIVHNDRFLKWSIVTHAPESKT